MTAQLETVRDAFKIIIGVSRREYTKTLSLRGHRVTHEQAGSPIPSRASPFPKLEQHKGSLSLTLWLNALLGRLTDIDMHAVGIP